jgi:F-box/leucine-rich repeat protein 2/20
MVFLIVGFFNLYPPHLSLYQFSKPIVFIWLVNFPALKDLSIFVCSGEGLEQEIELWENEDFDAGLELESLCLLGIRSDDWGLSWLW